MNKDEIIQKLSIDPVFGCHTRQYFEVVMLPSLLGRSIEVVFLDLDRLHDLNHKFGYDVVDRKIRSAIDNIYHYSKQVDIVRWYSGDEFIVLPGTSQRYHSIVDHIHWALELEGLSAKLSAGIINCENTILEFFAGVGILQQKVQTLKSVR